MPSTGQTLALTHTHNNRMKIELIEVAMKLMSLGAVNRRVKWLGAFSDW